MELRSIHDNALALAFHLEGALSRLRIPSAGPRRASDRLWEHTCFEVFVAPGPGPAYREFNLAPSGEWASYCFLRYREAGREPLDAPAPQFDVRMTRDQLCLDAILHLDRGASSGQQSCLRLGLAAVIEGKAGELSYWALEHPPGRPDFHHPDNFALEVDVALRQ